MLDYAIPAFVITALWIIIGLGQEDSWNPPSHKFRLGWWAGVEDDE